jgi:pimeloyl-ACP methyl ester carboxylesterase
VYKRRDQCIIAFRGTRFEATMGMIKDVFADALMKPYTSRVGQVHSGFWYYYSTVLKKLLLELEDLLGDKKHSVYITGHSLGGALAQIFSMEYKKFFKKHPLRACYVFNSPAWGSYETMTRFNELGHPSWRVYNEHDPVTYAFRHVPDSLFKLVANQLVPWTTWLQSNSTDLLYVETRNRCKLVGEGKYFLEETYGTNELTYKPLSPLYSPTLLLNTVKDAYFYHKMEPLVKNLKLCIENGFQKRRNSLDNAHYSIYYML